MNAPWWRRPLQGRAFRTAPEPGARLFGRIRLRLTVLYCGVLAAALLVFGVLLYLGVQQMLFSPIHNDLVRRANRLSLAWQASPLRGCSQVGIGIQGIAPRAPRAIPRPPVLAPGVRGPFFAACFGPGATPGLTTANAPPSFLDNRLALQALRVGTAGDQIDGGEGVGTVLRYAEAVPDITGAGTLGVVQVGEPVEGQVLAQRALLKLLLIMGGLSMLVAAAAGLLLSGRALSPARIAFSRQQTFVAAAAHELRTPLTLLRADAEVLLRGKGRLSAEDAELLEDIVAESAHMSSLATNMLTLARLDAGQVHLEQEVVNLRELMQGLVRRVSAFAADRAITVTAGVGQPVLVLADRLMLEQALLILLDNALKYNMQGGTVRIGARQEGDRALVDVVDSGIGIPPEHLSRLGERFYRVDPARSRQMGGVGLGLSIARAIAVQHSGSLSLASDPGRGTTATISLPALRQSPDH